MGMRPERAQVRDEVLKAVLHRAHLRARAEIIRSGMQQDDIRVLHHLGPRRDLRPELLDLETGHPLVIRIRKGRVRDIILGSHEIDRVSRAVEQVMEPVAIPTFDGAAAAAALRDRVAEGHDPDRGLVGLADRQALVGQQERTREIQNGAERFHGGGEIRFLKNRETRPET